MGHFKHNTTVLFERTSSIPKPSAPQKKCEPSLQGEGWKTHIQANENSSLNPNYNPNYHTYTTSKRGCEKYEK